MNILFIYYLPILSRYSLIPTIPEKTISLCCNSADSVSVEYSDVIVVKNSDPEQLEQYKSGSKLEFTLKSQNGKVEYEDGKVTLTIPEQLKAGRENLLDDINEHFKDEDNRIMEFRTENMNEGLPDSSEATNKVVADSGILGNIANVARVGVGRVMGLLWPQDQINMEPKPR